MMMKNIWDAVNWLKGEADDDYSCTPDGEVGLILLCKSTCSLANVGDYHEGCTGFSDDVYQKVCTIEDFNQCVAEMSDWLPTGWKLEDYAPNIKTEEEIQEMAKPVFTQAMADAGELPEAGSTARYIVKNSHAISKDHLKYDGVELEIIAHYRNLAIGVYVDGDGCVENVVIANPAWWKPIRSDRDDAMAEAYSRIYYGKISTCNHEITMTILGDAFDAGLLKLDTNH